jgi:hypothetical protein
VSQDTFNLLTRGYDVSIESAEDEKDSYKVTVQEGGGVGFEVIIPVNLDEFEGENEDLDGSDALMQYLGDAAVDLYEAQKGKLGEGATLHEEASMKRRAYYDSMQWEDWFMSLKGTPFEQQAAQMLQEYFEVSSRMGAQDDTLAALRIEEQKIIHDLNMMNLERMKRAPAGGVIIIRAARRSACWGLHDVEEFLARFVGDPQEAAAISKVRELLDIQERMNTASNGNDYYREHTSLERKMHDLALQAMQQNVQSPTGMEGAPNMANDLASLMEGVDLNAPLEMSARRRRADSDWSRQGEYINGEDTPRGLVMTPTPEGIERAQELLNRESGHHDSAVAELLEDWLANGWTWVPAEDIGALTDGMLISPDAETDEDNKVVNFGTIYWDSNYAVESALEKWANGESVTWEKHKNEESPRSVEKGRDIEARRRADLGPEAGVRMSGLASDVSNALNAYYNALAESGSGASDPGFMSEIESEIGKWAQYSDLHYQGYEIPTEAQKAARRAFSEVEPSEDRIHEKGEQLEGVDPGCVPEEDRLKFVAEDEVTTNKKLSIPGPGWGETTELPKGSKGRIENVFDDQGDCYRVRLEDGRLIKVSVDDLT